jgi:hypothetical protein
MKSFVKSLFSVLDSFARARAATHFSRMGRHDLAREIMLKN